MGSIGGQASQDFKGGAGALRILYSVLKDTIPSASADSFSVNNPNVIVATNARSTTLPATVKKGILGGSVAFVRPDVGQNTVGGAVQVAAAYVAKTRPLGLFINDAAGNPNENAPAVGSGKCPFLRGGTVGVKVYETQQQTTVGGGSIGTALVWAVGDRVYASVNGYLTNRWQDSYETQWITTASLGGATGSGAAQEYDVTCMGTVLAPPDASSSELFVSLNF